MKKIIRIGTRESQLAVWQATRVQELLAQHGARSELVYIKSEGDIDLKTPLYEIGVQGIFTRSLDIALLNDRIDIAVHSQKDIPTQLPQGIVTCAVLKRHSHKDLLVYKGDVPALLTQDAPLTIATSSIRRRAQWLNKYPHHQLENLRGNVNTRLKNWKNQTGTAPSSRPAWKESICAPRKVSNSIGCCPPRRRELLLWCAGKMTRLCRKHASR
jgi:hydroxymethylbilane synthase